MASYLGGHASNLMYANQGACARCNRADHLVSTDINLPGEAEPVLCRGCVYDIAAAAGFVLEENGIAKLRSAEDRAQRAETAVEEANRTISSLHAAWERVQARQVKATASA